MTEEDKQTLTNLARKFQASPPNPKVIISLDLELHKKIWEIAGNKTLE